MVVERASEAGSFLKMIDCCSGCLQLHHNKSPAVHADHALWRARTHHRRAMGGLCDVIDGCSMRKPVHVGYTYARDLAG